MREKMTLPQNAIVLKGLRGREGLSQTQLAKKINLSRSTISHLETGKKQISSETAKKLAKALKTKPKMFDFMDTVQFLTHRTPLPEALNE